MLPRIIICVFYSLSVFAAPHDSGGRPISGAAGRHRADWITAAYLAGEVPPAMREWLHGLNYEAALGLENAVTQSSHINEIAGVDEAKIAQACAELVPPKGVGDKRCDWHATREAIVGALRADRLADSRRRLEALRATPSAVDHERVTELSDWLPAEIVEARMRGNELLARSLAAELAEVRKRVPRAEGHARLPAAAAFADLYHSQPLRLAEEAKRVTDGQAAARIAREVAVRDPMAAQLLRQIWIGAGTLAAGHDTSALANSALRQTSVDTLWHYAGLSPAERHAFLRTLTEKQGLELMRLDPHQDVFPTSRWEEIRRALQDDFRRLGQDEELRDDWAFNEQMAAPRTVDVSVPVALPQGTDGDFADLVFLASRDPDELARRLHARDALRPRRFADYLRRQLANLAGRAPASNDVAVRRLLLTAYLRLHAGAGDLPEPAYDSDHLALRDDLRRQTYARQTGIAATPDEVLAIIKFGRLSESDRRRWFSKVPLKAFQSLQENALCQVAQSPYGIDGRHWAKQCREFTAYANTLARDRAFMSHLYSAAYRDRDQFLLFTPAEIRSRIGRLLGRFAEIRHSREPADDEERSDIEHELRELHVARGLPAHDSPVGYRELLGRLEQSPMGFLSAVASLSSEDRDALARDFASFGGPDGGALIRTTLPGGHAPPGPWTAAEVRARREPLAAARVSAVREACSANAAAPVTAVRRSRIALHDRRFSGEDDRHARVASAASELPWPFPPENCPEREAGATECLVRGLVTWPLSQLEWLAHAVETNPTRWRYRGEPGRTFLPVIEKLIGFHRRGAPDVWEYRQPGVWENLEGRLDTSVAAFTRGVTPSAAVDEYLYFAQLQAEALAAERGCPPAAAARFREARMRLLPHLIHDRNFDQAGVSALWSADDETIRARVAAVDPRDLLKLVVSVDNSHRRLTRAGFPGEEQADLLRIRQLAAQGLAEQVRQKLAEVSAAVARHDARALYDLVDDLRRSGFIAQLYLISEHPDPAISPALLAPMQAVLRASPQELGLLYGLGNPQRKLAVGYTGPDRRKWVFLPPTQYYPVAEQMTEESYRALVHREIGNVEKLLARYGRASQAANTTNDRLWEATVQHVFFQREFKTSSQEEKETVERMILPAITNLQRFGISAAELTRLRQDFSRRLTQDSKLVGEAADSAMGRAVIWAVAAPLLIYYAPVAATVMAGGAVFGSGLELADQLAAREDAIKKGEAPMPVRWAKVIEQTALGAGSAWGVSRLPALGKRLVIGAGTTAAGANAVVNFGEGNDNQGAVNVVRVAFGGWAMSRIPTAPVANQSGSPGVGQSGAGSARPPAGPPPSAGGAAAAAGEPLPPGGSGGAATSRSGVFDPETFGGWRWAMPRAPSPVSPSRAWGIPNRVGDPASLPRSGQPAPELVGVGAPVGGGAFFGPRASGAGLAPQLVAPRTVPVPETAPVRLPQPMPNPVTNPVTNPVGPLVVNPRPIPRTMPTGPRVDNPQPIPLTNPGGPRVDNPVGAWVPSRGGARVEPGTDPRVGQLPTIPVAPAVAPSSPAPTFSGLWVSTQFPWLSHLFAGARAPDVRPPVVVPVLPERPPTPETAPEMFPATDLGRPALSPRQLDEIRRKIEEAQFWPPLSDAEIEKLFEAVKTALEGMAEFIDAGGNLVREGEARLRQALEAAKIPNGQIEEVLAALRPFGGISVEPLTPPPGISASAGGESPAPVKLDKVQEGYAEYLADKVGAEQLAPDQVPQRVRQRFANNERVVAAILRRFAEIRAIRASAAAAPLAGPAPAPVRTTSDELAEGKAAAETLEADVRALYPANPTPWLVGLHRGVAERLSRIPEGQLSAQQGLTLYRSRQRLAELTSTPSPHAGNPAFDTWLVGKNVGDWVNVTARNGRVIEGKLRGIVFRDGRPSLYIDFVGTARAYPVADHVFDPASRQAARQRPEADPRNRGAQHAADWPEQLRVMSRQFGANAAAAGAADERAARLVKELDEIAIELGNLVAENPGLLRTSGDDPRVRALDAKLNAIFAKLRAPGLLAGTGFRARGNEALTHGVDDVAGWVNDPARLLEAAQALARKACVTPGHITDPGFVQNVMVGGRRLLFTPRTAEDKNWRMLYVEEMLLMIEERYHVAQNLLGFSAHQRYGTGHHRDSNISDWARSAPGAPMLDAEGDVFVRISEMYGTLPDYWISRYRWWRSDVPNRRMPDPRPGLVPRRPVSPTGHAPEFGTGASERRGGAPAPAGPFRAAGTAEQSVAQARAAQVNYRQLSDFEIASVLDGNGIRPRGNEHGEQTLLATVGYGNSASAQRSRYLCMSDAHPRFVDFGPGTNPERYAVIDVSPQTGVKNIPRDELRTRMARLDTTRARYVDQQFHTVADGPIANAHIKGLSLNGQQYDAPALAALQRRIKTFDSALDIGDGKVLMQMSDPYDQLELTTEEYAAIRREVESAERGYRVYVDPAPSPGARPRIVFVLKK